MKHLLVIRRNQWENIFPDNYAKLTQLYRNVPEWDPGNEDTEWSEVGVSVCYGSAQSTFISKNDMSRGVKEAVPWEYDVTQRIRTVCRG